MLSVRVEEQFYPFGDIDSLKWLRERVEKMSINDDEEEKEESDKNIEA